jgi:hypothetical protein
VPAVARSKYSDAPSRTPLTNGHQNRQAERSVMGSQTNRLSRSATGTDNGFGRSISKKSLDMAIKHMVCSLYSCQHHPAFFAPMFHFCRLSSILI